MKNILITGACGLVGRLTIEQLQQSPEKYTLFATDLKNAPTERYKKEKCVDSWSAPSLTVHEVDLTLDHAFEQLLEILPSIDVVIHLAAALETQPVDVIHAVNIKGAENVFFACAKYGIKKVIYASSVMTLWGHFEQDYAFIKDPLVTAMPKGLLPLALNAPLLAANNDNEREVAYCASKIHTETIAENYANNSQSSYIAARLFWIKGVDRFDETWQWVDRRVHCSHSDYQHFIAAAVSAQLSIGHHPFYVGSYAEKPHCFDFSASEKIGFKPQSLEATK